MKNITLIATACLILILLASMYSCHHDKTMRFGPVGFKDRIETITKKLAKDLDLTDEQKNRLNVIRDETIEKLSERKKHVADMFTAVREEIQKDSIDQQRLERLFDDRAQFREDMHEFMISKFKEFHSMLTNEQRTKLKEFIDKMENTIQ